MKSDWDILLAVLATMGIVFFLTILVVARAQGATCMMLDVQPSQVLGNYDGDTFTLSLGALGEAKIRIEGVDAPERTKKQPGWKEAKEFTAAWLAHGPFKLHTCFVITLGRIVGSPSRDGITLSSALIAAGHVKPLP